MAQIAAFKGIRYHKGKILDLSKVIAPPYDVISPSDCKSYYRAHPANIVRLILPQEKKGDTPYDNKYTRSGRFFRKWLEQNILIQDKEHSVYIYQQKYTVGRQVKTRTGFFALIKLEDFSKGVIFPHEETHSRPKKDRMQLLRQVKANLSPVFGLYDDPRMKIKHLISPALKDGPSFKIKDETGIEHRIWQITNPAFVKKIKTAMRSQKIYIADGHHRYETALAYCRDNKKQKLTSDFQSVSGQPGYKFIMMCLVSLEDEGLIILPTHRVLSSSCCGKITDTELINKLAVYFDIKPQNQAEGLNKVMNQLKQIGKKQHCLAMYTRTQNIYILTLRQKEILNSLIPGKPPVYRNLDVNILHRLIINHLLGFKPVEGEIVYTRDENEAANLVRKKKGALAFLLNATKIDEVRQVALSGNKMPQKSTYFYPKLPTGLVINKL